MNAEELEALAEKLRVTTEQMARRCRSPRPLIPHTDMAPALHFHVSGTPRPQSRPRFVRGRVVSSPSRLLKLWRTLMLAEFINGRPVNGPIREPVIVNMLAMFPHKDQKKWGTPHGVRPDKDNIEKAALDCLVRAGILRDDSLVCGGQTRKVWAPRGGLDVRVLPPSPAYGETPDVAWSVSSTRDE